MARPKEEKIEINEAYLVDALLLAGQYAGLLQEKKYYEDALAGVQMYTAEMAIDELSGSAYSDSERVQTSSISNPTERIGMLLATGYVEKKNAEILREVQENLAEYTDICEKIDIIEVAMRERMSERTRAVFVQIFIKNLAWSKVKDVYRHSLDRHQVSRERDKAIVAIAEEMCYRNIVQNSYRIDLGGETDGKTEETDD